MTYMNRKPPKESDIVLITPNMDSDCDPGIGENRITPPMLLDYHKGIVNKNPKACTFPIVCELEEF